MPGEQRAVAMATRAGKGQLLTAGGDAAKSVESVRLKPTLRIETAERAAAEGVTVSEIIRRALRQYLRSG